MQDWHRLALGVGLGLTIGGVLMTTCAKAITLGETMVVEIVCKTRDLVETQLELGRGAGGWPAASLRLRSDISKGLCAFVPGKPVLPIEERGTSVVFVDSDGDKVEATVVRVGPFWTLHIQVLEKGRGA